MSEDVRFVTLRDIARQSFIDGMAQRIDASPAAVAKALDNLVSRGLVAASGIEARSDETAKQAQPEGREPGPQSGDAQNG